MEVEVRQRNRTTNGGGQRFREMGSVFKWKIRIGETDKRAGRRRRGWRRREIYNHGGAFWRESEPVKRTGVGGGYGEE